MRPDPPALPESSTPALHRTLSSGGLIALGVGATIGGGIFVLTGVVAAQNTGPGLALAMLIAAFACGLAALAYAELAASIPTTGSAYAYTSRSIGRFAGWFVGWNLVLEYLLAVSTVSVGWSAYFSSVLHDAGLALPTAIAAAPFDAGADGRLVATGGWINLPAIAIALALTALCARGIRESSLINNAAVAIKVSVIVCFILAGAAYVNPANLTPLVPPNSGTFGNFGFSGLLAGAAVISFAFTGFDAVSTAALEARDPARSLPRGIIASLIVCTALYLGVGVVLVGLVPYAQLGVPAPVAAAVDATPALHWLAWPIKLGALAGMTSVILVMLIGQPRIFLAMAADGLLPASLARIHPRWRTPAIATIVTGVSGAALAGFLPVTVLSQLVSIGTLIGFIACCACVLVLRRREPGLVRPFRMPAASVLCPLGIVASLAMMLALPMQTWVRLAVWTVAGVGVYLVVGRRTP